MDTNIITREQLLEWGFVQDRLNERLLRYHGIDARHEYIYAVFQEGKLWSLDIVGLNNNVELLQEETLTPAALRCAIHLVFGHLLTQTFDDPMWVLYIKLPNVIDKSNWQRIQQLVREDKENKRRIEERNRKAKRVAVCGYILVAVILAIFIYLHCIGKVDLFWRWRLFIK